MSTSVYGHSSPTLVTNFLLELAVAGVADALVTHNLRHFPGVDQFGVRVLTPHDFLRRIGQGYEQGRCRT